MKDFLTLVAGSALFLPKGLDCCQSRDSEKTDISIKTTDFDLSSSIVTSTLHSQPVHDKGKMRKYKRSKKQKPHMALRAEHLTWYRAKNTEARAKYASYQQCSRSKMVMPPVMEQELAKCICDLDDRFHGLNPVKCKEQAYEYANKNKKSGVNMLPGWEKNKIAGESRLIKKKLSINKINSRQTKNLV